MSDRGNVLFFNGEEKSVVISSYWGSTGFVYVAINYAIQLKKEVDELRKEQPFLGTPLTRLQPDLIAVDFIRVLHDTAWITGRDSGTHLYRDEKEVENVYEIDLNNPSELLEDSRIQRFLDGVRYDGRQ